jgi:DNA polymerase-3 subunit epsilon
MPLKLTRPLVILDTETTGTNIYTDRIVEFAATRINPGDPKQVKGCQRFNPGIPIPKEASDIHHITDADVAKSPTFSDKAESILKFLSGCDFAGYNIKKFDLPLLEAEFKRAGITTFSWRDRVILDAYSIWLKAEPRDLSTAVKMFLGKTHEGAHGAEADTAVILDLLEVFVKKWNLPTDPNALYEWADPQNPNAFDTEGKLVWKDAELVFTFGKNNGRTLRELAKNDPSFLEWILGKDFSDTVKNAVKGALAGKHPVRKK